MAAENPDPQHYDPPRPLVDRTTVVYHEAQNTYELPHDPFDGNWSDWFNQNAKNGKGEKIEVNRENSEVEALIDGDETFASMAKAMETVTGDKHFIYLASWSLEDHFPLTKNGKSFYQYCEEASNKGVEIRVMLSGHPTNHNGALVKHLSTIRNCQAILDDRVPGITGSHHQKILIVNGSEGLIAFCGGIDIVWDRIRPDNPLHDVHCRIKGPAALDFVTLFVERWQDNIKWRNNFNADIDAAQKRLPDSDAMFISVLPSRLEVPSPTLRGETLSKADIPAVADIPAAGKFYVQIGRTYYNGTKHGPPIFSFAPNGEHSAMDMVFHAIRQAKNLIYMEDQYMLSMAASDALKKALDDKSRPELKVVILICDTGMIDVPHAREHRLAFIDNLKPYYNPDKPQDTNTRVAVCTLNDKAKHKYVHAKMYVMDDKFAIIGSANCSRRSWTNDSEVVAAIYSTSRDDKRTVHFAHKLRMRLWAEHLQNPDQQCFDPGSFAHWLTPPKGSHIETFNREATDNAGWEKNLATWPNWSWDRYADPDGS